jgi:hypothetical protein
MVQCGGSGGAKTWHRHVSLSALSHVGLTYSNTMNVVERHMNQKIFRDSARSVTACKIHNPRTPLAEDLWSLLQIQKKCESG